MTIPALSTADKSFVCSYTIGSNVDFRLAMGVINEITTYTTEYVEGKCYIPVYAPQEGDDESHHVDVVSKDVVYVKVGCRVSSDGYIHTWLINTQKVSELILWNTRYDDTYYAVDDTTVMHWAIEKLYAQMLDTGFVAANIKIQKYVSGTRLYMFGNYSNSLSNSLVFNSAATTVSESDSSWYPNNATISIGDILTTGTPTLSCASDSSRSLETVAASKVFTYTGSTYTDYTDRFNHGGSIPIPQLVDDYIYFGYSYNFFAILIDTLVAGNGTCYWEYWNGSAWDGTGIGIDFDHVGNEYDTFNSHAWDWSTCDVNGSTRYWIRAKITTEYTTAATIGEGYIRRAEYSDFAGSFFKLMSGVSEPIFWYQTHGNIGTVGIDALCNPTVSASKDFNICHIPNTISSGTGNNSGRGYTLGESISPSVCSGDLGNCGIGVATGNANIDMEPNRAYIWVPGYCQGASGGSQSECEANGGTWIPGHYDCDPAFTYDTSVSFTYSRWDTIGATSVDHSTGRAYFGHTPLDYDGGNPVIFLAQYYSNVVIDTFSELLYDDLDELKHATFVPSVIIDTKIYTFYTKHVAVALMTSTAITNVDSDWIVNWGANDYLATWVAPDGLSARDPGSTQTLIVRPITHHDEFKTGATDIEGGFLYDLVTSNAFLSRDPGEETKILYPVNNQSGFDFLYSLLTSDAFLSRDPGEETKILYPVCNAKFCFLYEFVRPPFADIWHLKTDGNDTLDGKTWTTAWEHWTHAMQNTADEATLLVEEGIYNDGETQAHPSNSIVIYLTKNYIDDVATVTVVI